MLFAGANITQSGELLKKIPLDYLHRCLLNPKPEIEMQIRQLRKVRELDMQQYGLLKKKLPYFVCGIFNPAIRRMENFSFIEYFVVDIDKISTKGYDPDLLRRKIQQDVRVRMCFLSPGEDGLKVLFKLSERCYDAKIYSLFYKAFVDHFSKLYDLEQVIDRCTSDVSRACFISIDPQVYYNNESELIRVSAFLPMDNPCELIHLHKEERSVKKQEAAERKISEDPLIDPDSQTMHRIRQVLNPKLSLKKEKPLPYVPEMLNEIMADLKIYVQEHGIEVQELISIQYGKKIRFQLGINQAEINMFYGKRGFSIVISPRSGTNAELNELMAKMIDCFLIEKSCQLHEKQKC